MTFSPNQFFEPVTPSSADTAKPARGSKGVAKRTKHKNILRVDSDEKHMHGFMVRVQYSGQRRQGWFSDKVYGDRLAALDAAIEFKRNAHSELGKPYTDQQVIGVVTSNTGIQGIRRRMKGGSDVFEVTWVERHEERGRIVRRTSFSIKRHGEKQALKLAIDARARAEKARLGTARRIRPKKQN